MKPVDNEVEDAKLNSAGQMAIRSMIQALPEEPVSMAWRSALNEQLLASAAKQRKKRRLLWFASPAAGLTLVTALAFVVMFQPGSRVYTNAALTQSSLPAESEPPPPPVRY